MTEERSYHENMRTIAICNLKGGVAKTTTVINLAADLAHDHSKRVLVIDADSQANATEFLGGGREGHSLATLLRMPAVERTSFSACFEATQTICASNVRGVDLLPADDSLMDLDLSKAACGAAWVECLVELKAASALKDYDFVLIDCPPAFNAAAAAALLAADEVIIPIKLDAFALRGMANLTRQIENMRKINPALRIGGVLPTMWYKAEESEKAISALRGAGLTVYPRIRRSNRVDAMTYRQEPLIRTSPTSGACRDYRFFARQLAEGRC